MIFSVDNWAELFNWASRLVTVLVLMAYISRKLILKKFLVGRWEGELSTSDYPNQTLHCVLVVSRLEQRNNSAFLIYKCEDTSTQFLRFAGTDRLINHIDSAIFSLSRKWSADFVRCSHQVFYETEMEKISPAQPPSRYHWSCTIDSIFLDPKMTVKITGSGPDFSGSLERI